MSVRKVIRYRPFYRYGSHIESIRLREYYGTPKRHKHDPIYSISIYARFSGQFFFKFSHKKDFQGKKIVVPCLDVIMIVFFAGNIQSRSLLARKAGANTKRVPPRHPIILLTSSKLNMAAESVKRLYEHNFSLSAAV